MENILFYEYSHRNIVASREELTIDFYRKSQARTAILNGI